MANNEQNVVEHALNAAQANAETADEKQQVEQLSSLLEGNEDQAATNELSE
ncbi:hypothetical protein [Paenibacillus rigui]|uniref:hypothetical protein n=1 Tax=Paenibacillus rigui TaxID=554312 RepID=UPI0015C67273|nr:hypothetical protein [Paenibacillus rigui]